MLSPVFASGWSSWHGKALLGKSFNEQDHPRDEHGHFIDGAGDPSSSDPVAVAEQVLADAQAAFDEAMAEKPPEPGEAPPEPKQEDYPEQEDGSNPDYDAAYDAWQEAMEAHEAAAEAFDKWDKETDALHETVVKAEADLQAAEENAEDSDTQHEDDEEVEAVSRRQEAFDSAREAQAARQDVRNARREPIGNAFIHDDIGQSSPREKEADEAFQEIGNGVNGRLLEDEYKNDSIRELNDASLAKGISLSRANFSDMANRKLANLRAGGANTSKVEATIEKGLAALDKAAEKLTARRDKLNEASRALAEADAALGEAQAVADKHIFEEPDTDTPEHDAWQEKNDSLDATIDKLNPRYDAALEKRDAAVEKFEKAREDFGETYEKQGDKVNNAVEKAHDDALEALDAEDEADPEPDFDDFAPEVKGKSWNPDNQPRGEDGKFGASASADWTEEDDAWQDAFDEATAAVENSMDKYFGDVESARDEEPTATATLEALAAVDALTKSTATSWNGLVATLKHSGSDVAKAREALATLRQDIATVAADYKGSLIALNNAQGAWGDLSVSDPEHDPVDKPAWSDHEPDKPAPEDASDPDSVAEWEDYRQNLEQAREDFADRMKEHGEYKDAVREHKAKVRDADKSRKLALKQERKAFDRLENKVNALKGFADEHLWELRPRGNGGGDKSLSFVHMARSGSYQRLWLEYEPNRWGKSLCDWVEGKEFVEEDHVRGPDGRFGSGDDSSADSAESTESIPVAIAKEARSLCRLALDRVKGWKEKVGAAATALIDKIPGGKYLRGKAAELKAGLEKRYGAKAVKAIVASGYAIAWGATGAGAVVGVPVMIPSPIAMLPGLVMAELYHQFSGKKSALAGKAWVGDMDEDMDEGLSQEDIDRLAAELVAALVAANDGNSGEPSPRGKVYDGVTGKAVVTRYFQSGPQKGKPYCVDEGKGRVPCGASASPAAEKPAKVTKKAAPKAKKEKAADKPKSDEIVRGTDKRGRDYCRQGGKPVKCPAKEEEKKPDSVAEPEKSPEPAVEEPKPPEPTERPFPQQNPDDPLAIGIAGDFESRAVIDAVLNHPDTKRLSELQKQKEETDRLFDQYLKSEHGSAEERAATKAWGAAQEETKKNAPELAALNVRVRERFVEAMKPQQPPRISSEEDKGFVFSDGVVLRKPTNLTAAQKDVWDTGKKFIESITEGPTLDHTIELRTQPRAAFWSGIGGGNQLESPRIGFAEEPKNKDGNVQDYKTAATVSVVHELGHYIEELKPDASRKAQEFLDYRVGDEKPVDMATIPNGGLMKGEMVRKNHFDRYFGEVEAYYVGKEYVDKGTGESYGTEIVSKGIEALYNDPVGFMSKDPEYATFVIGLLRS